MGTFKFIVKMIAIFLVVKALFFLGSVASKEKTIEKPMIERFVNEFIINNSEFKYPIKVDDVTTLRSRKLIKEGGIQRQYSLHFLKIGEIFSPSFIHLITTP